MAVRYDFLLSDLLFRVESEIKLQIPEYFRPFQMDNTLPCKPDILLQIAFETTLTASDGDVRKLSDKVPKYNCKNLVIYHNSKGEEIVRQEYAGRGKPCRLFISRSFEEYFCNHGNWLIYLPLEEILLTHGRMILHASAVIYHGKAYLFSAPSGGGKSTHADLWEKYYNAVILNGDKVILYPGNDAVLAYGGPIAGSSQIYRNLSAPVAGIFLVRKAPYNRVTPVTPRKAVLALYAESVKSSSNEHNNAAVLDLTMDLVKQIPVFTLECLPDKGAVECILQKLEGM